MLDNVHVLLVDDDADTSEMYVYGLGQYGATVTTATSVREAFATIRQEPPDVIVSDITLGDDEDGFALVRAVRALDPDDGGDVPAVALTGWSAGNEERRAIAEGFNAFCRKPCLPEDLAAIVSQQIEVARQQRARAVKQSAEQRQLRGELRERQQELHEQKERLGAQRQRLLHED